MVNIGRRLTATTTMVAVRAWIVRPRGAGVRIHRPPSACRGLGAHSGGGGGGQLFRFIADRRLLPAQARAAVRPRVRGRR